MGRKIKNFKVKGMLVLVILMEIIIGNGIGKQRNAPVIPVYAAGEQEEGSNNPDSEPEKPEAPAIEYKLEYKQPTGNHKYYITKPELQITHMDDRYETHYMLVRPNHTVEQGVIDQVNHSVILDQEEFQEGSNVFTVWMEQKQEQEEIPSVDDTKENNSTEYMQDERKEKEKTIEFKVDTKKPDNIQFEYSKKEDEDVICSNEAYKLKLLAEDSNSGIETIVYTMGNEKEQEIKGSGVITIPREFDGRVSFYAIDKAGNQSRVRKSKRIILEARNPELNLATPQGSGVWYSSDVTIRASIHESGITSGIQSYQYYVDGVLEGNKEIKETGVKDQQFSFVLCKKTSGIDGCKVLLECRDYAGNINRYELVVFIDQVKPEIQIKGMKDGWITSKQVTGNISLTDETQIKSQTIQLKKEDEMGKVTNLSKQIENGINPTVELRDHGIYTLKAKVIDMAGNTAEKESQIIIDQKNPIIKYVEQLEGQELKKFQWGYKSSDMIEDFTHFTYHITLDKRPYVLGSIYQKEGMHSLVVRAVDAAGNESKVQGKFVIDRTRPEVIFQGVDPEGVYEQEAMVSISTENPKDQIEEILLNGQKQKLPKEGKSTCKYKVEEIGNHIIEVKAKDLAGNEEQAEIRFEIVEKQNVIQRNFRPIKNGIVEKEYKKEDGGMVVLGIMGMCVLILLTIGIMLYRRKQSDTQ